MKKIEAVIRPFKLDAVREALEKEQIHRMTVFEVKAGANREKFGAIAGLNIWKRSLRLKLRLSLRTMM